MEISIKATPEEITTLVVAIQERCRVQIASIPTTKTDALSARITKVREPS